MAGPLSYLALDESGRVAWLPTIAAKLTPDRLVDACAVLTRAFMTLKIFKVSPKGAKGARIKVAELPFDGLTFKTFVGYVFRAIAL